MAIVGGMAVQKQQRLIGKGPDIVVATPGRLWSLLEEDETFKEMVRGIRFLVLDEADRMLEAGHFKNLDAILGVVGDGKRQTFVYSATMVDDDKIKQRQKRKDKNGKEKDDTSMLFGMWFETYCSFSTRKDQI